MRVAGWFFRPYRESAEKTAQLRALIRIRMSPGVPKLPPPIERRSPLVTTNKTPAAASPIPNTLSQPRRSFKKDHPNRAIKTGGVETIQAVVEAWAVGTPADCNTS